MSAAVKTPLTKIQITERGHSKLYLIGKEEARAVETLLKSLIFKRPQGLIAPNTQDSIPARELYPELNDPIKGPALSFHGMRLKQGLTQKALAEKIGISQSDVSKIEKGERTIGKKLALRIGKALGVDYKRFL